MVRETVPLCAGARLFRLCSVTDRPQCDQLKVDTQMEDRDEPERTPDGTQEEAPELE